MKRPARMDVKGGRWCAWARALGAVAATLAVCGPAQAFYWHDWPGSRVLVQQTVIPQQHQNSTANPPTSTPPETTPGPGPGTPRTPPPPIGPPVGGDKPPVGPQQTPEPGTGLLALLGLGAMAAARRWRRS